MLEGLRSWTIVGGDHEERGVDLADAHEHVADEPVVPGDVDVVDLRASIRRSVGVADVDGQAAATLLGQAVGVDAGQRPQQRRLAVVDVPGRPDDDGHARGDAERAGEGTAREPRRIPGRRCAGPRAPRHPRCAPPRTGHPCAAPWPAPMRGRVRSRRATEGSVWPGRAAASHRGASRRRSRPRLPSRRAPRPATSRSARCAKAGHVGADGPPHGDIEERPPSAVDGQRGRHGGERGLVRAHGTGQGVAAHPRDEVRAADDETRLGSARGACRPRRSRCPPQRRGAPGAWARARARSAPCRAAPRSRGPR